MNQPRRDTPSYHRNIEPITQILHELIEQSCSHVLEIASGSGQHIARFASEFPKLQFQPTEYDRENLPSIDSWCENLENVAPSLRLDATQENWFEEEQPKFDLLLCFNVIHITPWEVTQALFKGADKNMAAESQILFYGPYKINRKHTSESNVEFENWLKEKDSSYGIRDLQEVKTIAQENGFILKQTISMPANNFMIEFARA